MLSEESDAEAAGGAAAGGAAARMASADAFATAAAEGSKALLAVPQSLRDWEAARQFRMGQVENPDAGFNSMASSTICTGAALANIALPEMLAEQRLMCQHVQNLRQNRMQG